MVQITTLTVEKTIGTKPICAIYRATSDDYFARFNPQAALGATVELAFLDGMHLCEFLLRDFLNVERNLPAEFHHRSA